MVYVLIYCTLIIFKQSDKYKQHDTLVCPNLYWEWSTSIEPRSFSAAFLLSMNWPSGTALAFRILYLKPRSECENPCSCCMSKQRPDLSSFSHLCLKSPYRILLGKPFLQILMPSNTPLQRSWWITSWFSITPVSKHMTIREIRAGILNMRLSTVSLSSHALITVQSVPGVLVSFGIKHLTKWGWVVLRLDISLFRFSCEFKMTDHSSHSTLEKDECLSFMNEEISTTHTHTLKRAETVWKDAPFFLAPFLPLPLGPMTVKGQGRREISYHRMD